jgi:hypothetical protein
MKARRKNPSISFGMLRIGIGIGASAVRVASGNGDYTRRPRLPPFTRYARDAGKRGNLNILDIRFHS